MANAVPSMAALKQIGDILYELKDHPQFQTEITNVAMEQRITDPKQLRALIEERLQGSAHASATAPVAYTVPAQASALPESVTALVANTVQRPQTIYSGSASLEGVADLAAPTFPSAAVAPIASAMAPAAGSVASAPTPITNTTSGFIASASLGVEQFRPPTDLPDVRLRATEAYNGKA